MNNNRHIYTLVQEPIGADYNALLREARKYCATFSLMRRLEMSSTTASESVWLSLKSYLRETRMVSEWPGTRLLSGLAELNEYHLVEASLLVLETAAHSLYEWLHPERPEDLVLWRGTGEPWLATIAHEQDAFCVLTTEEHQALLRAVPSLELSQDSGGLDGSNEEDT